MSANRQENLQNEYYESSYEDLMAKGSLGLAWRFIHRSLERRFDKNHFSQILEIGAGQGQHFAAVRSTFDQYIATDTRVNELQIRLNGLEKVVCKYADAHNLPFPDDFFDRVIVTCVFAHLESPHQAINEMFRVLKSGGVASVYLPCEPGILLRLMRTLFTRRQARKMQIKNFVYLHFIEHRNYFLALDYFVKMLALENAANIRVRSYPFWKLSWNFNIYKTYEIRKN